MKPEQPNNKVRVREVVDKANARRAESNVDMHSEQEPTRNAMPVVCPLCNHAMPASEGDIVTLSDYATAQRNLLGSVIHAVHPEYPMDCAFHLACLQKAESELQSAQIRREEDGGVTFVDLTLAHDPILATPIRMEADLRFTGRGVTIAFVDSGFYPHNDFLEPDNRILALYDAVRGKEIVHPDRPCRGEPSVRMWHGTMTVASAAGSGYESHGRYRGIASQARLVLVRAMTPNYRVRTPQVARALEWIIKNQQRLDIRIVNLSLGVDEVAQSLDHPVIVLVQKLVERGVVVVAASGNNVGAPIKPPGASPLAITVGGYNDNNSVDWMRREMWHSSYLNPLGGDPKPNILAPSIFVAAPILPNTGVAREAGALFRMVAASDENILATIAEVASHTSIAEDLATAGTPLQARSIILARIAAEKLITPFYKHVDGTSFAAPIVSSVVAQMIEAWPEITPEQVRDILYNTAVLLPDVPKEVQGHGVVNPALAVEMVVALASGSRGRPLA